VYEREVLLFSIRIDAIFRKKLGHGSTFFFDNVVSQIERRTHAL
jgi:hypothetical protein